MSCFGQKIRIILRVRLAPVELFVSIKEGRKKSEQERERERERKGRREREERFAKINPTFTVSRERTTLE